MSEWDAFTTLLYLGIAPALGLVRWWGRWGAYNYHYDALIVGVIDEGEDEGG